MARKKDKDSTPRRSFLSRFFSLLPLAFVACTFLNIYLVYAYVRKERDYMVDYKSDVMRAVSNVYHYVQSDISNHIEQVRFRSLNLLRPVYSSPSSVSNSVSSSGFSVSDDLPPRTFGDVEGTYFRFGGLPYVTLPNGLIYGLGEDFGLGEVSYITPLVVVCGGFRYRLVRPSLSLSPSSLPVPPLKKDVVKNE